MINRFFKRILFNRWAAFIHDMCWVPVVILIAYWIRFNLDSIPAIYVMSLAKMMAVALPIQGASYWIFGLYRGLWRYASLQDLFRVLKAVCLGTLVVITTISVFLTLNRVPRSVFLLYPLLLTIGLIGPRILYRWFKENKLFLRKKTGKRTLIVGAGITGELLLRDLVHSQDYLPVALVDDDRKKCGREIHGVRVLGVIDELEQMIETLAIDIVLVAIPDADRYIIRKIVQQAAKSGIECRTIPSSIELADKQIDFDQVRPVTVEDLLGRDIVALDSDAIAGYLNNKCVLVSGGGGSIGSELCRQIAGQQPGTLIIFELSEFNLYSIEQELKRDYPEMHLVCVLGDVKNEARVDWLFKHYRPEVVFHAAAYKHVPMLEDNPAEGVANNVFGTIQIARAANYYKAKKFVFVSTDKAVNPANVMGTTKRIAEIYCQNMNDRSETKFITTRFGNVLGSAGSVVPLFQKQIENGGPVTVTSKDVTRYFMTIPEATGLILQAGAMGKGGEIFVLDMGESVLIRDLAEQMIKLSGFVPDVDIKIEYIGLRPGEKLYEEVFHKSEDLQDTEHYKLQLAVCRQVDWDWFGDELDALKSAVKNRQIDQLLASLCRIVPEYKNPQIPSISNKEIAN